MSPYQQQQWKRKLGLFLITWECSLLPRSIIILYKLTAELGREKSLPSLQDDDKPYLYTVHKETWMGDEIKRMEIISTIDLGSWPKLQRGKQNKSSSKAWYYIHLFYATFLCQLQLENIFDLHSTGCFCQHNQLQKWLRFTVKSSNDHGFLLFQKDAVGKLVGFKMLLNLWKVWRTTLLCCKNFRAFRALYNNGNISKMSDGQTIVQCRHLI